MDAPQRLSYWGKKLLLVTTTDGMVCAFSLANPKNGTKATKRSACHRHWFALDPCSIVCDKEFAGVGGEEGHGLPEAPAPQSDPANDLLAAGPTVNALPQAAFSTSSVAQVADGR